MAEEFYAHDLGVLPGRVAPESVALAWIGMRGSSALSVCSPGREPGGGWELAVLGFLLGLASAS